MELKDTYSATETARLLDISRQAIYAWIKEGKISAIEQGVVRKRIVIPASAIRAVLREAGFTLEERLAALAQEDKENSLALPLAA
jgi:excisionase family DNA binding protein